MNWTYNCSLYNTLERTRFGTLIAGRSAGLSRFPRSRWSRGVRQRERWMEYAETFSNANAGWNTQEQIVFWSNLNCKFEFFYGKTYYRGGSDWTSLTNMYYRGGWYYSRPYKLICKGGLGTAPINIWFVETAGTTAARLVTSAAPTNQFVGAAVVPATPIIPVCRGSSV